MNLKELNAKIQEKLEEVRNLAMQDGKADEARAAKKELDDMQARLSVLLDISDNDDVKNKIKSGSMVSVKENEHQRYKML